MTTTTREEFMRDQFLKEESLLVSIKNLYNGSYGDRQRLNKFEEIMEGYYKEGKEQ